MNSEFNYYIHLSGEADYNKFFKGGLINFDKSYTMGSTMTKIPDEIISSGKLGNYMQEALRETDSLAILIKIPKSYFPTVIHRDGSMDIPIPILYEKRMCNPNGVEGIYPVVIPNLIQGCYSKTNGFITNPVYCPVFDPSGLKFAKEQLAVIKDQQYDKYLNYNKRNVQFNIMELYQFDKTAGTWDSFVEYYSTKFNVEPTILFDEDQLQTIKSGRK